MFKRFLFFLTTGALIALWCSPLWAQDTIPNNHFKAYSISPKNGTFSAQSQDQFMQDLLQLMGPILLANPVQKDTFSIINPTHHLHWYNAFGRDTLITVNYENQFETTTVDIDSVRFFLVPAQKFPHNPPFGLDHYKCYKIRQSGWLQKKPAMLDQFTSEGSDSLRRDLFCTPCKKNNEPTFDTFTHYVAYLLAPGQPFIPPLIRQVIDQFSSPVGPWVDTVLGSKYLLVPTIKNLPPPPPPDTGKNHYKTWRVTPLTVGVAREVRDQFMIDTLDLVNLEFLSNPVRKIVPGDPPLADTFPIVDEDDHLTWYRAFGRDTLLSVEYVNQFESTTVDIDSVHYLLLPANKDAHVYDSLDHYKAYRIRNPQLFNFPVQLEDQFDRLMGTQETVTSLLPVYFLTPSQKTGPTGPEPTYDTVTHYVAYQIQPQMGYSGPPHLIADQFLFNLVVDVFQSQFVLVPTIKKKVGQPTENCCYPVSGGFCGPVPVGTCVPTGGVVVPACLGDGNGNGIDDACDPPTQVDTLRNHFKTWKVFTPQMVDTFAVVRDQFTIHDFLHVDSIDYLSNPVQKIVFGAAQDDTSDITRPDDHLSWYRVTQSNNRRINVLVTYVNQFESTKVFIDTVKYFLLPTQKDPHPKPDSLLGHYTAYRIHKPKPFQRLVQLQDQFDLAGPELIDSLLPRYFLTPAQKENEPVFGPDTHYVAYEIFPKSSVPALTKQTLDQWGLHFLQVQSSELLLVPSRKDTFVVCIAKPGDANASDTYTLADVIAMVNYVFNKPGWPPCAANSVLCWLSGLLCRGDWNASNNVTLADVIQAVNFIFNKPGGPWNAVPVGVCCIP